MKTAKLGDFLLWNGEPAEVIGEINDHAVVIELIRDNICPHCGGRLPKKSFAVVDSSPQFQENAGPVQTIG